MANRKKHDRTRLVLSCALTPSMTARGTVTAHNGRGPVADCLVALCGKFGGAVWRARPAGGNCVLA